MHISAFMLYLSIVTWEFFSPCLQSVIVERFHDEVSNLLFGRRVHGNIPGVVKVAQQGAQCLGQIHRTHIEPRCLYGKKKLTDEIIQLQSHFAQFLRCLSISSLEEHRTSLENALHSSGLS